MRDRNILDSLLTVIWGYTGGLNEVGLSTHDAEADDLDSEELSDLKASILGKEKPKIEMDPADLEMLSGGQ